MEAIADYDKALELKPEFVEALHNRGLAYSKMDSHDRALADLTRVTEIKPEFAAAYHNRGLIFSQQDQTEQAIAEFTKAIELEENNLQFYMSRRKAYEKLGQAEQAQADGEKVKWLAGLHRLNSDVVRAPEDAKGYIQRAAHLAQGGHGDIALANFNKAIELEPSQTQVYTSRAAYWVEQGEYQKAIEDCEAALKIEPSEEAYSILGDAHLALGDYDRAVQNFAQTKRFDRQVAEAYLQRSKQRESQGDAQGAKEDLLHAQSIDPSLH